MATRVSTQQELYEILKDIITSRRGDFTDFKDGSMLDIITGAFSTGENELSELIVSEFKKTFFETSHGPEVTGNVDELQILAVDHYGDDFKRPEAVSATGSVTFSRANTDEGNVLIPAGTVIKTVVDALGQEILFTTTDDVTLTGLSIDVLVSANVEGSDGNVDPSKILVIDSPLTDTSVTVSNPLKLAGGSNAEEDAEYRETIRNLIKSLVGATKDAIEGKLKSVSGISIVTLVEIDRVVIDYDIATDSIVPNSAYFRIPYPIAYIGDENGGSSEALISLAEQAVELTRACGVRIEVRGATAVPLSWDAAWSLNAGGPNFSELQNNPEKILSTMADYISELDIGIGFIIPDANDYIFNIWGPSGTGDISSFNTNTPVSNISVQSTEKLVPSTMSNNGVSC